MLRPDAQKWHEAAKLENIKPIGSKWVFKVKRNADGSINRYKGRVVTKGYNQRPGIDFNEVFAPAARWSALNGELEPGIDLYMKQLEGFHRGDPDFVAKLMKGLYGLRQGDRL